MKTPPGGRPLEERLSDSSRVRCHGAWTCRKPGSRATAKRFRSVTMAYCSDCGYNRAASDCDYGLCGGCCDHGACHRHGWFEHECETCGRLFENQNNLYQHMRTHMPRNKYCPACGKFASSSVSGVTMHLENGHGPVCRDQGASQVKDFVRQKAPQFLRPAIRDGSASESSDEVPYCNICDRSFGSFGALFQHKEAKHSRSGSQLKLTW